MHPRDVDGQGLRITSAEDPTSQARQPGAVAIIGPDTPGGSRFDTFILRDDALRLANDLKAAVAAYDAKEAEAAKKRLKRGEVVRGTASGKLYTVMEDEADGRVEVSRHDRGADGRVVIYTDVSRFFKRV